jgi:hypothetical protein
MQSFQTHGKSPVRRQKLIMPQANKLLMADLGKILVVIGLVMAAAGALLWAGVGRRWLGRLPGDIHYSKGNASFYFPLATCLLLSILLSFVLWLLRKL